MKSYNSSEIKILYEYYNKIVIGELLERTTKSIIQKLEIEEFESEKYLLNAVGYLLDGSIRPKRSIDLVARDLNIPAPDEVLNK